MLGNRAKNNAGDIKTISLKQGSRILRDWVGGSNPNDTYKIRLTGRSTLSVNLSKLRANADATLLNQQGRVVAKSARAGRRSESITRNLNPGTYYIQVSRRQGNTNYQVELSVSAAKRAAKQKASVGKSNTFVEQVLQLTNNQRSIAGLQPLKLNPQLSAAAYKHSQDMALNDFFSHVSSTGATVFDRVTAAGYTYSSVGENIAAGQATPQSVVQAWMDSPPHRANILNSTLQEIGIGFYHLANDPGNVSFHYYWTQDFGTPMM